MSHRKSPRERIDGSLRKSYSLRKTLHSDVGRSGSATSSAPSTIRTLKSLYEDDSEEERQAIRFGSSNSRPQEQFEMDSINAHRMSWMTRTSTTGDLPFFRGTSSASQIYSERMPADMLTKTYSNAGSSDEESIANYRPAKSSPRTPKMLRRAFSDSSDTIRRMGSKLVRTPSQLFSRSSSGKLSVEMPASAEIQLQVSQERSCIDNCLTCCSPQQKYGLSGNECLAGRLRKC